MGKMSNKKVFAVIISIVLVMSTMTGWATKEQSEKSRFKDLPSNHWAYLSIMYMTDRGIMSGYDDKTFKPDKAITRVEFAKIMVLALDLDLKNNSSSTFEDIAEDSWAKKYVEAAKYYLTGFRTDSGKDYFKPNEEAVREDMSVALVKARGYGNESADENILNKFLDSSSISDNLKKFVAIAVKHNIMQGSTVNGSDLRAFKPQGTLTRAEASRLLYNALKEKEEKVTYGDDSKVTYDEDQQEADEPEEQEDENSGYTVPQVSSTVEGGKLVLRWDRINDDGFQGYKVVISKNDSTPQYPDNGYLYYITDRNRTSAVIDNSTRYNGGDFGGVLAGGQKYYFSVTALYDGAKVPGNVLHLEFPGTSEENTQEYTTPRVTAAVENGKVVVRWNKITDEGFQGYKVVISKSDSTPQYPDNGYLFWITDKNRTSAVVDNTTQYNGGDIEGYLKSGESYYFSVTALYNDRKVPGNVVRLVYPG